MSTEKAQFDKIGNWSEIKLDIIKKYAEQYSKIFRGKKQELFSHVYIDAFAGAGISLSKKTGELVPGSPLNALNVEPPFREFHFIDIDGTKVAFLQELVGSRPDVHIYEGDCNRILLERVFPNVRYEDFRRGLCLLDPYGLHLNWEVIQAAGRMRTIDLFLNFPIMDMNRNALWRNPDRVSQSDIERMNSFWGDESWRNIAYQTKPTLFEMEPEKAANEEIAENFRKRLINIAQFKRVLKPMPMRNKNNAVVYYLFFASQYDAAERIAKYIFKKYQPYRYNNG